MSKMIPFPKLVAAEIEKLRLLLTPAGAGSPGLLVALSGGPDSTALLLAARDWAETHSGVVVAAHLNHLLRGDESDADEDFCRDLCAGLDIELHTRRADARIEAETRGRGEEEAGRQLRRQYLAELLDADPRLHCCATGHHRDDQTETVVMRLFRGAGLDGIRGILPVSGRIIHPLLIVDRNRIESFLREIGQPWRTDRTNHEGGAARSRIRHELLPLARDILGAGVDSGPARLAELAGRDASCLDQLAREFLSAAGEGDLPVAGLRELPRPVSSRALRIFLDERHGLDRDLEMIHLDSLLDWLDAGRSGSGIDLIHGWRAWRDGDFLRILDPDATAPGRECDLSLIDSFHILKEKADPESLADIAPEAGIVPKPGSEGVWRLTLPAAEVEGEPRLRLQRPGDRIVPFGMKGSKKVSDLLSELKIPHSDRAGALIVEDDAGILWVVGVIRAERTRLLPGCGTGVTISVLSADRREVPGT